MPELKPTNAPVQERPCVSGQGQNEYSIKICEFTDAINNLDVRQLLDKQPQGPRRSHLDKPNCLIFTGTHGNRDGQTAREDPRLKERKFRVEDKITAEEFNKDPTFPYNVRTYDLGDPNPFNTVRQELDEWKPKIVVLAYCHSWAKGLNSDIGEHVRGQAHAKARLIARQTEIK